MAGHRFTTLAKKVHVGGNAPDSLTGDERANLIIGLGGDDTLDGAGGNDILAGGRGADTFLFTAAPGAANADRVMDFVSGTDKLVIDGLTHLDIGTTGALTEIDGRFFAAAGATSGQGPFDRFIYNTSTGDLWYDADAAGIGAAQLIATFHGAPTLKATDIIVINGTPPDLHVVGTEGDDMLVAGAGHDIVEGLGGNDTLQGSGGDLLVGGAGDDLLVGGTMADGIGDDLQGQEGNDVLVGTQAEFGSGTHMSGGDGDDSLYGGRADHLFGGPGADRFFFNAPAPEFAGNDIGDFQPGIDKIVLDSAGFAEIGATGDFAADDPRFLATEGDIVAQDADDRLIYFVPGGHLYYDPDGAGGADARFVAFVQSFMPLTATDITVI